MSEADPLKGLQFQKAEFEDTRTKCGTCQKVIENTYYHFGGAVVCPECADIIRVQQERPKNGWVLRGALYGAGMAAACTIGYSIVTMVTGLEIALIAILVGYLIGQAVRRGSHGLGGRRCQVLAVLLTYGSITISYVPLIIKGAMEEQSKQAKKQVEKEQPQEGPSAAGLVAAVGMLSGVALLLPFLGLSEGISGIIGVVIIFYGLLQAWQQTARDERLLMGPYTVEQAAGV